MLYLISLLIALSVGLLVTAVLEPVRGPSRNVSRELSALEQRRLHQRTIRPLRQRVSTRARLVSAVHHLGGSVMLWTRKGLSVRQLLVHAGMRGPEAVTFFWGARAGLTVLLGVGGLLGRGVAGQPAQIAVLAAVWAAAMGWLLPMVYLRGRVKRRRREILTNLPDALDLLVVCVEAGLGLNQALNRMAEEIRRFSPATGQEFGLVNLEIRAGSPREEALRNLGERTGLAEVRALAAMLVQTDRFGTSVANALRVHADGLRSRRRQGVEEAAAKTTIKLVFPLVLCILPALFIIVLGPIMLRMFRSLAGF